MKVRHYAAEINFAKSSWLLVFYIALHWILFPWLVILSRLLKRKILFGKTMREVPEPPRKNDDELSILRK